MAFRPGFACILAILSVMIMANGLHTAPPVDAVVTGEASHARSEPGMPVDAEAEYRIQPVQSPRPSARFRAVNRQLGLRMYFTDAGVRILPRDPSRGSFELQLELVGTGRDSVPSVEPSLVGQRRVEIDHGRATQWFVNDRGGLQHGVTLVGPADDSLSSVLRFRVADGMTPEVLNDGAAVRFLTSDGGAPIRYEGIVALDAAGIELDTRVEWESDRRTMSVVIATQDATFPVNTFLGGVETGWVVGGLQGGERWGAALATAGDVNGDGYFDFIVGAPQADSPALDQGRVALFLGSPIGPALVPQWEASGSVVEEQFGRSLATAGDVNGDGYDDFIVGAPQFTNVEQFEGRVVVYYGSALGPAASPDWEVEGEEAGGDFGAAVATAGDLNGDGYSDIIIGAPNYGASNTGAAFVYYGSPTGLSQVSGAAGEPSIAPNLFLTVAEIESRFGASVSTAGDVNADGFADVAVGAPSGAGGPLGRAFVYHGSASGPSTAPDWTATGDEPLDGFGSSVSSGGDITADGIAELVVGAPSFSGVLSDQGRVSVFHGSASGLSVAPVLTLDGEVEGAMRGSSVAGIGDLNSDGLGDVAIVSEGLGKAFIHLGSTTGLTVASSYEFSSHASIVAAAGDVDGNGFGDVLIGEPVHGGAGRATLVEGIGNNPAGVPYRVIYGQTLSQFGTDVGAAGDVNGDGYDDVIIGQPLSSGNGFAYVHHGAVNGVQASPAWSVSGLNGFGSSVDTAGDVNGDGYADVIVGTPGFTGPEVREGAAYVYHGSPAGLSLSPDWSFEGNQDGAELGTSVAWAGDVNGDGYSDVIVGAPFFADLSFEGGKAFLFLGAPGGLEALPAWTYASDLVFAHLGAEVAGIGDVNGDGYSDVAVGAPDFEVDFAQPDKGRVYAFFGSAGGPALVPDWIEDGIVSSERFGRVLADGGDVNGDGYSDLLAGRPTGSGSVLLYYGQSTGLAGGIVVKQGLSNEGLGFSVDGAGDVNGDGYADILIGGEKKFPLFNESRAILYFGSPSGPGPVNDWTTRTQGFGTDFIVSSAGDSNGDGFADIIVGARNAEFPPPLPVGNVSLYYGGSSAARPKRLQQRTIDDSVPIGRLGLASGGFRVSFLGFNPWGRCDLKLEVEAKPLGTPFDGLATSVSDDWIENTGEGVALNELVSVDSGPAHWRARVLYRRSQSPLASYSRWFAVTTKGWAENDLRVVGCIDLDGDGYGAFGNPACPEGTVVDCNDQFAECSTECIDEDSDGFPVCAGDCDESNPNCTTDCTDGDSDGFCVTADCDDSNAECASDCTDADGDGYCATNDCDESNANCTADCTDADGDGYCVGVDCDEGNPNCLGDCTDGDGDGYCVDTDCDDSIDDCNVDCGDADGDGVASCDGDCDDINPNCSTDCTDVDADGFCVTTDCDDTNPGCDTDCTDSDGDSVCVNNDCDDSLADCSANCADADGDGFCGDIDCDDSRAFCTSDCTDVDDDGLCVGFDCDDSNAGCLFDCTDSDFDGFCVETDCDDSNPNCTLDCGDVDADGFCAGVDCDDSNPTCTVDCTDVDGDGFCANSDCDDTKPFCQLDCTDADSDGHCIDMDCDETEPACNVDCSDDDADGLRECLGDCDDENPQVLPGLDEVCVDGADNDCNGLTDDDDPVCADLEVTLLRFPPGGTDTIEWEPALSADSYQLYRGRIPPSGMVGYNHLCEATQIPESVAIDADVPAPGRAFYYLVAGQSVDLGASPKFVGGPLGQGTAGARPDSPTISCGVRVHVDPDVVVGSNDGLTWSTAFTNVGVAMNQPLIRERGAEVWVRGTVNGGGASLFGGYRQGARILGGFAGSETLVWERSPEDTPTVLDGTGANFVVRALESSLVVDGLRIRNAQSGVMGIGEAGAVEVIDVQSESMSGFHVDVSTTGSSGGRLLVEFSEFDGSGAGALRGVASGGTLTGRIRHNVVAGGSDTGVRLEARPGAVDAAVDVDVVANTISGAARGLVLGAFIDDVPLEAVQRSFVGSNLIYGTADSAVRVEANGIYQTVAGNASAVAEPTIVGNTLTDSGGSGVDILAFRLLGSGSPLSQPVRAVPQIWDNLITFHAGAGIEETQDDPAAGVVADPVVVRNDLFGNSTLYVDEGSSTLTIGQVNGLPGNSANFSATPGYVDSTAGDYHIQAGTVLGLASTMRFIANESDPGIPVEDWTALVYDDSSWSSGTYGVGYDTGPLPNATQLLQTTVPPTSMSVFSRVTFEVADPGLITALILGVDYDDGYVAWINGVEVVRSPSMPGGPVVWNTPSLPHESSNGSAALFDEVDVSALGIPELVAGTNVLAIGVWNEGAPSDDLVLVPRLILNQEFEIIDRAGLDAPRVARQDLDGDPRVADGDADGNPAPDTGADER